jgi:hypothetical protein
MEEVIAKMRALYEESALASPGRLSEIIVELNAYSAYLSERLDDLLVIKADKWMDIRHEEGIKSDKMADRIWDTLIEGKQELMWRGELKRSDKVCSAIKMRLKILEGESFGRY